MPGCSCVDCTRCSVRRIHEGARVEIAEEINERLRRSARRRKSGSRIRPSGRGDRRTEGLMTRMWGAMAVAAVLLHVAVFAQQTGAIAGVVRDSSGAVLPG